MSSDIAIRVSNLSKCYEIYDTPRDRLKQAIVPKLHRAVSPIRRLLTSAPSSPASYFKEFWALRDVSFEVRKGETVGIIGRNGSGKSTLLQLICGTLTPTAGEVQVNGRVAALLELGAGFNPEFTGRENVYMSASILGMAKEEVDARFDDISAFADIGEFIDQPVKSYSSGMYVRLAFAVIAHVDADILVIDEALAVGDAFFTQKCMRFLREFQEEGSILFVSHDTGAVINLCQHAVWLKNGHLSVSGPAKDVCESYLGSEFESTYGIDSSASKTNKEKVVDIKEEVESKYSNKAYEDQRLKYINQSSYRNDVEVFDFTFDGTCFGVGGGRILGVSLETIEGKPLSWTVGGEDVMLVVNAKALQDLDKPIVGFYIKDRLGQFLFGENTYFITATRPFSVKKGKFFQAKFSFKMPILQVGDYSICVALANGTQQEHLQHHWIHDALILKSHSSSVTTGLVGIPMKKIEFVESI